MGVELSIVVPTYNERENIGILIERIDMVLRGAGVNYEVVIVDDNSPDGTADYAEELARTEGYPVKIVRRPGKLGLASAVIDGIKAVRGVFIAVMDADLQHPPEVLPQMLKALKGGCDIAIASRYVEGGSIEGWSLLRKVISKGAILIVRILLPKVRNIKDPISGYFMFRKDVIEGVLDKLKPRGYKTLLEILVRGRAREVCEVPYTFRPRYKGRSKLSAKEVIDYLLHILDLAPSYVKFAIVGALGTVVNLGTLTVLTLEGIPHAIASATAIEVSILNNFILNDIWTFRGGRKDKWWHRLLKFHGSSASAIIVQWTVSNALYYLLHIPSIIAQLVGIVAGFVLNYMLSKKFVWRTQ